MSRKVEVQKGPITPNSEKNYKHMTHSERVKERQSELAGIRDGQTLILVEPKTSRK